MSNIRNVRKSFNFYVDGKGFAGNVESFTAPKLTLKTEEFQGGGMFGAADIIMGHDKLEAEVVFLSDDPDVLGKFSVVEGKETAFSAREALESADGTVTAVVHNMRGKIKEIDRGETKSGEKATTKVAIICSYYKLTHGGTVVQEIDVPNMIVKSGGADVLAPIRKALGI
ncbi:TPA: phage major tail tube protein [Stenotrophomonas maltophilia]